MLGVTQKDTFSQRENGKICLLLNLQGPGLFHLIKKDDHNSRFSSRQAQVTQLHKQGSLFP